MATKTTRGRPKGSGINDDKIIKKITGLMAKDPDLKATTAIKAVGITDPSSIRRLREKLKTSAPDKKTPSKKSVATRKATTKKAPKAAEKTQIVKKAVKKTAKKPAKKKAPVKKTVATRKAATATKAKPANKQPAATKKIPTRTAAASRAKHKTSAEHKIVETRKAPSSTANAAQAGVFQNPFEELTKTFGDMAKSMPEMSNGQNMPVGLNDLNIESIVSSTVEKQIQFYEATLKFSPMANLLRQQALLTDMMLTMLRTKKEFSKSIKPKN